MNLKSTINSILFIFLSTTYANAQEDILNYGNSAKYAAHLFENKCYDLSAIEYERVVYLEPTDTLAKLRLVQSYRMMNDLKTAKAKLDGFYPCCTSCCNKAFATENFRILFLDRQYDTCLRFLSGNKALDETTIAGFKAAALLMQHNWKEACKLTKDFTSANPPNIRMAQLREIAEKGESIRYKDPYLAATFSGIIPGSGKLYAGQWKDGLYSFLVVSALSYITYRSFEKSSTNPYGFIFGTMAFSFHTANIFGSFKSAVRQNRMKNQNTVREVDKLIFEE